MTTKQGAASGREDLDGSQFERIKFTTAERQEEEIWWRISGGDGGSMGSIHDGMMEEDGCRRLAGGGEMVETQ